MEVSAIAQHMRSLLTEYQTLRGTSCRNGPRPTWDVVAITTADNAQQEAFQLQLDDKYSRNELPLDLPIHIISDPPGPRIGMGAYAPTMDGEGYRLKSTSFFLCKSMGAFAPMMYGEGNGGSTLVALEFLESLYGDQLFQKKVLLIHAGGWSQRMPSATILGKIFAAIPHGEPVYQMLDLKLALYWPFVSAVAPGVFLVCADDFLVYDLGLSKPDSGINRSLPFSEDLRIPETGFTALAHPSAISIGRTHGVYVVDGVEKIDTKKHVVVADCLEVLQKPNDERMKKQGALLKSENNHFEFADGITMDGEVVYTDSSFYFGVDAVKKMLKLKKEIGTIMCEIDAYGDFLQALGPRATDAYIFNISNVSQVTSDLTQMRKRVFDVMHGSEIHLLILNASKFIHIGTTKELIYHFCQDKDFKYQMALDKNIFNTWQARSSEDSRDYTLQANAPESTQANGCVMHSFLTDPSIIDANSVVEYCHFDIPVIVKENVIVSNCQWLRSQGCQPAEQGLRLKDEALVLPADTFLHTVSIKHQDSSLFVTVFFAVSDNLKASVPFANISSLPFFHKSISSVMKHWQVSETTLACGLNPTTKVRGEDRVSLWTLKLYPGAATMTQSLSFALEMIRSVQEECALSEPLVCEGRVLFSLADLLAHKDVVTMLNYRRQLFHKIQSSRGKATC